MSEYIEFTELAQRAQQGDKGALDRLAELAESRLRVYVYRMTLQEDLTAEIVQETLLEMCRVIGRLKNTERFLPWLYGIATNKLRHFYRSEQTMKRATATRSDMQGPSIDTRQEGLENLVSQELKEIVSGAIQNLKTRHRAVLVMRCYDGLSYAEIAESMGGTEFGTRMLFMRAKKALQKQLSRQGLGRGTFMAALVLFGKMTAPSKAAAAQVSISAATLNTGVAASVVGVVTSKAAVVGLAGVMTLGAATGPLGLIGSQRDSGEAETHVQQSVMGVQAAQPVERQWCFMPDGPQGAVLLRAQGDRQDGRPAWVVLQDSQNNYYYDGSAVKMNNAHWYAPNGRVMRLPHDSPQLRNFLDRVEGVETQLPYAKVKGEGALVESYRKGDTYAAPQVQYNRNVPYEDFFLPDWPSDVTLVDSRDYIHQRGWTHFTISGQIQGELVKGSGYLPLNYRVSQKNQSRLHLQVGDLALEDSQKGAWLKDKVSDQVYDFRAGTFFSGLSRPWSGLHTIDTIRRDAAVQGLWFETHMLDNQDDAEVTVAMDDLDVTYHVNLARDLVQRITLAQQGQLVGELLFDYTTKSRTLNRQMMHSRPTGSYNRIASPGIRWLTHLCKER